VIAVAEQFLAASEANKHFIVLDLTEVDYVSSAGLREIMSAMDRAIAGGGGLRLANPAKRVWELLELTGLDHHLPVFATRDEAVRSFV
jgi:anti-anti-sigma factor